jgi:hypothetical protein
LASADRAPTARKRMMRSSHERRTPASPSTIVRNWNKSLPAYRLPRRSSYDASVPVQHRDATVTPRIQRLDRDCRFRGSA